MPNDPIIVGSSSGALENIDIARGILQQINIHAGLSIKWAMLLYAFGLV